MTSNLKYIKLDECAKFSQGKQVPVEEQYCEPFDGSVRFVRIVDFTNENEPPRYIKNYGDSYQVNSNDLIMIRYGSQTAGKVVRGFSGIIANNMFKVDIDRTLFDINFAYYYLSSPKIYKMLMNAQSSSTMPAITFGMLGQIEVPLFDLETQQKIAKVLGAIDDKIELNNSIKKNIEQQAQAIFKSWFIDFEPFGGVMPDDWMYKELGDLGLDISDGNYSSKYPKTNEFVNTGIAFIRGTDFIGTSISKQNMYYITEKKHKELLKGHTKKDDLLITTRGEIGRIAFVPDSLIDVNINSQLVRINGNKILPKSYLACSLLSTKVQNDFKSLITGSALQQLPIGRLKKIILLKPSTEILNHFDKIVGNLFKVSDQNYEENERLTQLRDTLLPKLMSGEIDVDKVEV